MVFELLFPARQQVQAESDPSLLWTSAIRIPVNCSTSLNYTDFVLTFPFYCPDFNPPHPRYSFLAQCFHTYRHTNGWFTGCTEAPVGREIRRVGLALVQTDCADREKRVTPETQTMEEHRGKEALRFCRRNTMMRSRPVPSWLCATRMKSTHQPGAVALAIACHLALAPSEMHGYW